MAEREPFEGHLSSARQAWLADAIAFIWVAGWVAAAIVVAIDVHRLASLADTEASAAGALQQIGNALVVLSHVPLVGGDLSNLAGSISATAISAKQSAIDARSSTTQLSWLLGLVIAIAPSLPVLALYIPFRWRRVREVHALRGALHDVARRDEAVRYLAARALTNLPYGDLTRISADPWRDFDDGQFAALAAAEAGRLGLNVRRWNA